MSAPSCDAQVPLDLALATLHTQDYGSTERLKAALIPSKGEMLVTGSTQQGISRAM
jgi:hypothetical protein